MADDSRSRTLRFLVVDDLGLGRSVLQAMLLRYGEVETANDGDSALALYRDAVEGGRTFDLALLDIMMPGMDGLDLFDRLRAYERERRVAPTPVVMTTALDQKDYVYAAVQRGASGYLIKPLELERVHEILDRLGLLS